jgi:molybdate/tungstate transport system substrate-binding protein
MLPAMSAGMLLRRPSLSRWRDSRVGDAAAGPATVVRVGRASTLAVLFDGLARELPGLDCEQQSAGSAFLIRRLTDLHAPMDVLAVADAELFRRLAAKPGSPVTWWIEFARNELVLAYTAQSTAAAEINAANWYHVLQRRNVASGYADPALDPEGYNTLIAWKLAERYYNRPGLYDRLLAAVPAGNIRPDSTALLGLLAAGELDYAWQYLSVARQHKLRYVTLPREINLGDPDLASMYATATVEIGAGNKPGSASGRTSRPIVRRGAPIEYAVTIPATSSNPAGAIEFVAALLSAKGQALMRQSDQPAIVPARAGGVAARIPAELRRLTVRTTA